MQSCSSVCFIAFVLFALPTSASRADADTDDIGSAQVYFDRLLGGAFYEKNSDIVLGKLLRVVKPPPKEFTICYELEVAGSYRGILKEGARVTVGGDREQPGNISDFGSMPELPIGATVMIAVDPTGRAGELAYKGKRPTPFGLACPNVVEPEGIDRVKHALAEMRRLVPLDGKGPVNHDEAERLLASNDRLSWALGATLLAYEGTPKDVHQLMLIFGNDNDLTVQQALWLHYLVTWVVKEHARPLKPDADEALVGFFKRYGVEHVSGLESKSERIK